MSLPTPNAVYTNTGHFAYYQVPADKYGADIAYRHYTDFLPVDTPDSAWFPRSSHVFTLTELNNGEYYAKASRSSQYILNRDDDSDYLVFPNTPSELYDAVNAALAKKHAFHEQHINTSLTTGGKKLPRGVRARIIDRKDTLFEFHSHWTYDSLRAVDGIGDKTAYALLHQGQYHNTADSYTHASAVFCPDCGTAWKAQYPPDIAQEKHALKRILYCPTCHCTDFSTPYIGDPEPFTYTAD